MVYITDSLYTEYRRTAKFSGVDLPTVSVVWNSVHIEYYRRSESCRHFLAEMVAVFSLQLVFLLLCYYITFADYSFPLNRTVTFSCGITYWERWRLTVYIIILIYT